MGAGTACPLYLFYHPETFDSYIPEILKVKTLWLIYIPEIIEIETLWSFSQVKLTKMLWVSSLRTICCQPYMDVWNG